jgi:hypothetical protein
MPSPPNAVRRTLDAEPWREFSLIGWVTVVAAGIGMWGWAATTVRPDWAPDWIGWPVALLGMFMAGAGFLGLVVWRRERGIHASDALDLVFEGAGTRCLVEFGAEERFVPIGTTSMAIPTAPPHEGSGGAATAPLIASTSGAPVRSVREATVVRLHVINLRSRRLSKVRVRLLEVRSADGSLSHPESDWLKWMHDDGSSHSASIDGRQVESGNDESAYLDLATKVHRSPAFVLEFAMPHLRAAAVWGSPHYVSLVASGEDEATERSVPECRRTFRLDVDDDGRLLVLPSAAIVVSGAG